MAAGGGLGKLLIRVGLKSSVKADGKRVERETGAIAKGIEKKGLMIGAGMTAIGVGAKLMADNINKSYLTFDTAMAEVKSLGGVTAEQMAIMRSGAIGMSKELPLSAKEIAGGFYMMRSAGFDAARVIEELPAIAKMAVAGNLEMADAVNATTMVLDVYGEAAGSAADITNVLMGTVQAFKTTLPELHMQLSKNIGVAASLNIEFGELAAMSGMLKKEFVSAEEAGTAMKTMLLRLVDPTVIAKLDEMGIKVEDADGNFVGMLPLLDSLSVKLDEAGGDVAQMTLLQELFGTEGLRAAMSLIRQKDELKGYTDAVGSGTAIQEALNAVLESTQAQLDIANNKMEAAKITMGEAMAPATILTANAMAAFAGVLEDMPGPLQTVIGGGLQLSKAFIGIGPLLMGISVMYPVYAAAQLSAAAAGTTLTASIWASTVALLANPIFWIPAVIMVVVGALYVLEKKFGAVSKSVDFMSEGSKRLFGWFKTKLEPVINIVQKAIARFGDKLLFILGPFGLVIWIVKKLVEGLIRLARRFRESGEEAEKSGEVMSDAMKEVEKETRSVEEAQLNYNDALLAYHRAIIEFGEGTKEAKRATWALDDAEDHLKDTQDKLDKAIEKGGDEVADLADETTDSMKQIAKAVKIPEFSDLFVQFDKLGRKQKRIDEEITRMADMHEPIKDYENALKRAEDAEKDLNDAIKATGDLKPEVDELRGAYEDLERAMRDITDLNEDIEDQGRAIEHAQFGVTDAQKRYTEAVREYGSSSHEAAKADLRLRDAKDRLDDAQKRQKYMEGELSEAIETKGKIEEEYGGEGALATLKGLLDAKQTEYDAALKAEEDAREAHKLIMDDIAKREANEQIAQWKYMKDEIEANPVDAKILIDRYMKDTATGTELETGEILSAQHGGIIPGPLGRPVPIIAHGGEEFLGVGGKAAVEGDTFNVGPVTITNDYDVESLWRKLQELQQSKRMQRGMTVM